MKPSFLPLAKVLVVVFLLQLSGCGGGGDDSSIFVDTQEFPSSNELVAADRSLDFGIAGDGMFVLRSKVGGQNSYSRYGRLDLDGEGQLIHVDGSLVLGRSAESPDFVAPMPRAALRIPARATSSIRIEVNLDSRVSTFSESFDLASMSYNSATSVTLYFQHRSSFSQNTWHVFAVVDQREIVAESEVFFALNGSIDPLSPTTLSIPVNSANVPIVLDMSGFHSWGSKFTVTNLVQDGYGPGSLNGVLVDQRGALTLRYDNGASLPGGQLVLARFNVADRLTRIGQRSWQCVRDCQVPTIDIPLGPLYGSIQQGSLNVAY